MPAPRVSIRLGTDGKAQVQRDFLDIGDTADAQAQRIAASYGRAANDADAALAKLQKASERMASVAPPAAGGPTNSVNPITGGGYDETLSNARTSAGAMTAQMAQQEQEAQRLLAATDPLYAAQMRYNQSLDQAIALQKIGMISDEQFASIKTGLTATLTAQTGLVGRNGLAANQARVAQMELEHAVRGSMDAFAAGAPPARIFAMHLGMLAEAAQLSGGSFGKVGAFLAGPWGIAITLGVMSLVPLLSKLAESGSAVDSLVSKLKKEAEQARENDTAHQIFAQTLDGVTDATRRNEDALKKMGEAHESSAQKALASALAQVKFAQNVQAASQALIDQAKAKIALDNAMATGPETKSGRPDPYLVEADAQRKILDQAQSDLTVSNGLIARNQADVLEAMSRLSVDAVEKMNEPVSRIKANYSGLIESARAHALQLAQAARSAGDEAKAQALVGVELEKQVAALQIKEDAEIKAAEARDRKGPANAGGTAIFDAQIASFFDIASKYRGDSETRDKGVLEAFFKEANLKLDPEKTAWCAAFVNAVLAAGGVKGTGSLAAKSFLTFGKDDTHSPQKGDIAVVRTGAGDHVGIVDNVDKSGNVTMLAGNTSNKVAEATYNKNQVLAIRRPPTPSEQAANDNKDAEAAQRAQSAFDEERSKLDAQMLAALGLMKSGYEVSAGNALRAAQAEHDAEALKIANNLAEGKYGVATGELARTRARELQSANDAALAQKQASISLNAYVKWLDQLQANADQQKQFQLADLKFADEFARSNKDHRTLQLEMLDIQYQQKEYDLKILKSKQQLAGDYAAAERTQAEINRLPTEKGQEQARVMRSTQSPWEQYVDELKTSTADLGGAFEQVGVDGLKQFDDGLTDVLTKSNSLADAWHNLGSLFHDVAASILADLIKIAEKEAILAIFKAVMGAAGGGGGGDVTSLDIGSFADNTAPLIDVPAFGNAGGTESSPGGLTWVGEFGKELVRLPRGAKVSTAAESRRIEAANDAGIGAIHINIPIDATGADAAGLARVQAELAALRAGLPAMIVNTYQDARTRFVVR